MTTTTIIAEDGRTLIVTTEVIVNHRGGFKGAPELHIALKDGQRDLCGYVLTARTQLDTYNHQLTIDERSFVDACVGGMVDRGHDARILLDDQAGAERAAEAFAVWVVESRPA